MMEPIYILFTGLMRLEPLFMKSLQDFEKNPKVKQVIFITWQGETNKIKNKKTLKTFKKLKVFSMAKIKPSGGHYKEQMSQYRQGMNYIKAISKTPDYFVMKTRTDVYIKPSFFNEIINTDLRTEKDDPIMSHKVWIPWVHRIKPFYFEDAIFYSHQKSMNLMINDEKIFDVKKVGQGITHIRRFINPFLNKPEYNALTSAVLQDKDNIMSRCQKFTEQQMTSSETGKMMFEEYHKILSKYYYVHTPKQDSITFRIWNKKNHQQNMRYNLNLIYH